MRSSTFYVRMCVFILSDNYGFPFSGGITSYRWATYDHIKEHCHYHKNTNLDFQLLSSEIKKITKRGSKRHAGNKIIDRKLEQQTIIFYLYLTYAFDPSTCHCFTVFGTDVFLTD